MEISIGMSAEVVRMLSLVAFTVAIVICLIKYMDRYW